MVKIQYENDENRKEKGRLSNQLILLKEDEEETFGGEATKE